MCSLLWVPFVLVVCFCFCCFVPVVLLCSLKGFFFTMTSWWTKTNMEAALFLLELFQPSLITAEWWALTVRARLNRLRSCLWLAALWTWIAVPCPRPVTTLFPVIVALVAQTVQASFQAHTTPATGFSLPSSNAPCTSSSAPSLGSVSDAFSLTSQDSSILTDQLFGSGIPTSSTQAGFPNCRTS